MYQSYAAEPLLSGGGYESVHSFWHGRQGEEQQCRSESQPATPRFLELQFPHLLKSLRQLFYRYMGKPLKKCSCLMTLKVKSQG